MELIAAIPLVGPFLAFAIPFLVVLGIVVFVHEYGHYIVGRWCGIHAEVFSIGYGKTLYSWLDSRGTRWQIAALPLGGYVKFLGDTNAASFNDGTEALAGMSGSERAHSFPAASIGRRALTVAAGPVFNFILSAAIFAGMFFWQGKAVEQPTVAAFSIPLADYTIAVGDEITSVEGRAVATYSDLYEALEANKGKASLAVTVRRDGREVEATAPYLLPPLVGGVQPLSAASEAGLRKGDLILALNGKPLVTFDDLKEIILASEGIELQMEVLRGQERLTLPITPKITTMPTEEGGFEQRVMIGIAGALAFEPATGYPGPLEALLGGTLQVWETITNSLNAIYHIVTGQLGAENLQGPLGIAKISGESANQGLENFIFLIASLSTAIGFFNLFPVPILDGGHLLIYAYEAIVGRPPHEKFLNAAMSIGFVLLMALMVFATYNDITRI